MDWAAEMLGLDAAFYNSSGTGGGVIQVLGIDVLSLLVSLLIRPVRKQTTASDSALVATVAARSRCVRRHPNAAVDKLVLYTTTQTHSLGQKAGLILGVNVRALEVTAEDNYALRGTTLKRALEEDANAGLYPFILSMCYHEDWFISDEHIVVVATVGTTSSGAIDHLEELGDIGK